MVDASSRCLIAHPCFRAAHRVAQALAADGWQATCADSATDAREQIGRRRWDILVTAAGREELLSERLPTIALAARGDPPERLLDLGADAVCRGEPLRAAELRARARGLLHSARGVRIDPTRHRATLDGVELDLTPKEFALLAALAGAPGELFSRSDLGRLVWGAQPPPRAAGRALDAHAARLKKKLGSRRLLIQTVWGLGYRLAQPGAVEQLPRAPIRAPAALDRR